jgi:predicted metal-dependent hydrolase
MTQIHIDQLIRSRRKTIAIIIHKDGSLVVRAPLRTALKQIQALVDTKASWIKQKQELVLSNPQSQPERKFNEGESFLFLGKNYPLQISDHSHVPLHLNSRFILEKKYSSKARAVFTAWYVEQARRVIGEKVTELAALHGFTFNQFRITSAKTRWGSCSSKGGLNFSWRLVMAPPEVIEYVVIHELAHLDEHNHGASFWARVKTLLPDYATRRRWLKENGHLLTL